MTHERRLRAPDHPGEDVVAADGGAQQVRRRRGLLRAERAGGVAQLGEPVRREQRREDRGEQEDAGEHEAGDEHAALQADALAELADRPAAAPDAGGCVRPRVTVVAVDGHQYLTRGSMSAAMTSTMKLVTRDDDGEQDDDALDGDEVAGLQVLDELEAEALPLEGRLGEHRAAEQQGDLQPDDGDDRDQRRPVGVLAHAAGAR